MFIYSNHSTAMLPLPLVAATVLDEGTTERLGGSLDQACALRQRHEIIIIISMHYINADHI